MTISLIVAAADNNIIGKDNKLLWHIPEDLKRFKAITLGKPCIMGRKTFESILDQLGQPLPGRTNIVVTRSDAKYEGARSAHSLEEAIMLAKQEEGDEVMIIGGAQIYEEAIRQGLIDKLYLTRVHQTPEGDATFPEIDETQWNVSERERHDGYSFLTYQK